MEKHIIDAISTNETFFFRDNIPFELLKNKVFPDLIDKRCKQYPDIPTPLRIWSVACSTGQEVYSVAIILLEMLTDLNRYNIHILGTDISNKALAQASYGQYNQFEISRGMPENLLKKYFHKTGSNWQINDEVRILAKFKHLNLMQDFGAIGKFDVILCRNVAIYFNQTNKIKLFKKLAHSLAPDGVLIIGSSETLHGFATDFKARHYLKGTFYQLKGSETAQYIEEQKNAAVGIRRYTPSSEFRDKKPAPEIRPPAREKPDKKAGKPADAENKTVPLKQQAVNPDDQPTPNKEKTEQPEGARRRETLFGAIKEKKHHSENKTSFMTSKGGKKNTEKSLLSKGKKKKGKSLLDRITYKNNE